MGYVLSDDYCDSSISQDIFMLKVIIFRWLKLLVLRLRNTGIVVQKRKASILKLWLKIIKYVYTMINICVLLTLIVFVVC